MAALERYHPSLMISFPSSQSIISRFDVMLAANNERPPMVLRVNRLRLTREQYLARLADAGIAAVAVPAAAPACPSPCTALAALITLSSVQLYRFYGSAALGWGLTALSDQQLGGLAMWLPGDMLYMVLIVWTFKLLLDQAESETGKVNV